MNRMKEILQKARSLPPLPHSVTNLMKVMADEKHSLNDIVRIVELDTTLTAVALKAVNSAAFGLREPVTSIARAVSFLGEKSMVGMALSASAPDVFDKELGGYESRRGEMWAHSLKTALAAREMAPAAREEVNQEMVFTAGMLHDIGKSILSHFLIGQAPEMLASVDRGDAQDYLEAEKQAVGVDHCEAGFELARAWRLPAPLAEVIRFHHKPGEADEEHRTLVYLVHLGDITAMMTGSSTGADALGYDLDESFADFVDLKKSSLERIMMTVMLEFEKIQSSITGQDEG